MVCPRWKSFAVVSPQSVMMRQLAGVVEVARKEQPYLSAFLVLLMRFYCAFLTTLKAHENPSLFIILAWCQENEK